jgi:hypothetical protein
LGVNLKDKLLPVVLQGLGPVYTEFDDMTLSVLRII